jgi:hypothetical protein
MRLVEVFDDRQRLQKNVAAIELERRHPQLRIDGPKRRAELCAAVARKMNRRHLMGDALEIKRDARAKRRRRSEIGVEQHSFPPGKVICRGGLTVRLHCVEDRCLQYAGVCRALAAALDGDKPVANSGLAGLGSQNRAGDLAVSDLAVRKDVVELALPAVGCRDRLAAGGTVCKAAVDAIAIGVVGDDKHALFGFSRQRGAEQQGADKNDVSDPHSTVRETRPPSPATDRKPRRRDNAADSLNRR